MINIDEAPICYWDDNVKISYLQRHVIVHSLLYYELNVNVISDKEFDILAKQLVSLQTSVDPIEVAKSDYWYLLYDFDGSTGFDIPDRLNEYDHVRLISIAHNITKLISFEKTNIGRKVKK